MLRILMIGDIVGRPGRTIVRDKLSFLRKKHEFSAFAIMK
ncbi:MAG TPA: YmdB family metallophosphoesterase, partial [Thermoanaerobacterales bacterium]|nr:YmdB family metallophosphoesterase [Thermoanaerobacterales bacterium]